MQCLFFTFRARSNFYLPKKFRPSGGLFFGSHNRTMIQRDFTGNLVVLPTSYRSRSTTKYQSIPILSLTNVLAGGQILKKSPTDLKINFWVCSKFSQGRNVDLQSRVKVSFSEPSGHQTVGRSRFFQTTTGPLFETTGPSRFF